LLAAGLLVVAAAFVAVLVPLIKHGRAHQAPPAITAYVDGRTTTVAPFIYCTMRLQDCTGTRRPAVLTITGGKTLQISVPRAIYAGPWTVHAVYRLPGQPLALPPYREYFESGTRTAVTIPLVTSVQGVLFVLDAVKINAASAVQTDREGENYATRGIWGIQID
jgi:hypothetical protein